MKAIATLAATAILTLPFNAAAMSGKDFVDTMSIEARTAYAIGAVEMAMWTSVGNNTRIQCIKDWYYSDTSASAREITELMGTYPAKPAAGLLKVLIDRKCGAQ